MSARTSVHLRFGSSSQAIPLPHTSPTLSAKSRRHLQLPIMGSIAPTDEQSAGTTTDVAPTSADINAPGLVDTIVDVVVETLDGAAGSHIPIAELHGGEGDEEQASDYWDASSMAPLNAVSAVSFHP